MDQVPQVDMTHHTHPALDGHPMLSSEQSGWNGIFFHHYDHPAHQSPTHQWMQHIIGITGQGGHPVESEHQVEGQLLSCYCQPGEMLFIPAGVNYSSLWHEAGEFSLLGFSPHFFEQVAHESVRVKQIELALKADIEAKHPAGRMFGESLATGLVIHLLKQYSVWQPRSLSDDIGRLSEHQLQKVFKYVQDHLEQNIALSDMASVLNLSQYHFCRLFKQSTGLSPHQYLTQCRINCAKHLLQFTQLTITEITFAVGLNNHSSFTRLFHRYVGTTPKEFRASL
jgi:AraC family transcriptional regulator